MEYKITGGFNSGLKVRLDNDLIMYSVVERKLFSPDTISIFNGHNTLILKVLQKSGLVKTKYHIDYQESTILSPIHNIKNDIIELSNKDAIEFKGTLTGLISNPYVKIYYRNSEIGQLSNTKIALKLDYTLSLEKEGLELLPYVLVQILVTESNKDYD